MKVVAIAIGANAAGAVAVGAVCSPAFRPQASGANPFRDAKRLRPKGGTTN